MGCGMIYMRQVIARAAVKSQGALLSMYVAALEGEFFYFNDNAAPLKFRLKSTTERLINRAQSLPAV